VKRGYDEAALVLAGRERGARDTGGRKLAGSSDQTESSPAGSTLRQTGEHDGRWRGSAPPSGSRRQSDRFDGSDHRNIQPAKNHRQAPLVTYAELAIVQRNKDAKTCATA
jgi:hypothetical protein